METAKINIIGKTVTVAYCYATEIAFKKMSAEDINDFTEEITQAIKDNRMPDVEKSIMLIMSAMLAYCQATGTEQTIQDSEIMTECSPKELSMALAAILGLRIDFYKVDENDEEKKGEPAKN